MNAIIGLPNVDTSELIFPRNSKLKQLVARLGALGYTITSENHIALCLLLAEVRDYGSVKSIQYDHDSIKVIGDQVISLDSQSVRMLAKGMKHFVIDDNLRFYARKLATDLLQLEKLLLFVNCRPPERYLPLITIPDVATQKKKPNCPLIRFADVIVPFADFTKDPAAFLAAGERHLTTLFDYQAQAHIETFIPAPAFGKKDFPKHHLMQLLKASVKQKVAKLVDEHGWQLDNLDLEYQTLFRLTTYPTSELCAHSGMIGYESQDVIHNRVIVEYYNSLDLMPADLNHALIEQIIIEQSYIIRDRLEQSPLPIELFLRDRKTAESDRPVLKKTKDGLVVLGKSGSQRRAYFGEVDLDIARQVHRDLHYIHTPRSDLAFGLFYEDEKYPFTVVALERVDRPYKQAALALFGYDAMNCLDFTRLYSRPGGPKNASSVVFRELKLALRDIMPNIQAGISAHMPTYTHGHSMLAGGFETPFLLKANPHSFTSRTIDGKECYEMLTKRRLADSNSAKPEFVTRLPLLPVVDLIAPFNKPRVKPRFIVGETVLIRNSPR